MDEPKDSGTDAETAGATKAPDTAEAAGAKGGNPASWLEDLRRFWGGFLRRFLRRLARPDEKMFGQYPLSPTAGCVVLGPVSSGKTALFCSLDRCAEAHSHSYQDRYEVDITGGNPAFDKFRGRGLETLFATGLVVPATQPHELDNPELRMEVRRKDAPPGRGPAMTFGSFDASGGLLEYRTDADSLRSTDATGAASAADQAADERAGKVAHYTLLEHLLGAESVLFCVPLGQGTKVGERHDIAQRIYELSERPNLRRLVVCFTMYEKLGRSYGRRAFRELARRDTARALMAETLGGRDHGIGKALKLFEQTPGKSVWCIPISTYGFVAGNGGINYDPANQSLLVRCARVEQVAGGGTRTIVEPYYSRETAWEYWRPFCTLDPFVFIATGDREGTLIHSLEELGL